MKKVFGFALALILPAAAAHAVTYQCKTTNFGRGGWVPSEMVLTYSASTGEAQAYDPFIHAIHKKPINVDWKPRSADSSTFRWKLKGLKSVNAGTGTNSFKVTLFEKRNAFSLSGRRHGYDNVISASGSCKRVK